MTAMPEETHPCPVGGTTYLFRTPTLYDPAIIRRQLTRQRVRRPGRMELNIAALHGLAMLAEAVDDVAEGERQQAVLREWHKLLEPIDEDQIDEPDLEARAAEVARQDAVRKARLLELQAEVAAIEATLERHWQPYAELLADRTYWDEIAQIETVRLLLIRADERELLRDKDGLLTSAAYRSVPAEHRGALAHFAFGLMSLDETQRKN